METKRVLRAALIGCCALMLSLPGSAGNTASVLRPVVAVARMSSLVAAKRPMLIPAGYTPVVDESEDQPSFDEIGAEAADSIVNVGLQNAGRLLPSAKKFTIEALRRTAVSVGLPNLNLSETERQINAIDSVVLDNALYDWAEVDLNQPSVIRVGVLYAYYLSSNEEAVFLLGHELTHVAAWRSDIELLMDSISAWSARVSPEWKGGDVKEDLACDFIGAQALKLYMFHYPSVPPVDDKITEGKGRREKLEGRNRKENSIGRLRTPDSELITYSAPA